MAKLVLDRVLKRKKITKYRFAQLLGVATPSVFRFFRPNYDPKLSTLQKWADVLEVKVRDLYMEKGED
jgi:DNA-binding XRE family transcriptional regulator